MRMYLASIAVALAPITVSAADWLQFGFDASHSGINSVETTLSPANVHQLRLLYSTVLPDHAEGAPVFLGGVATASGSKDLLFLTLRNGALLALDAVTGATLWSQYPADTDACVARQVDEPCVTASSPALDPNRAFVYNYALDGYVHKYRVGDGGEILDTGWPELASAKPDLEQESAALAVAKASNGSTYLYAAFSSASWLSDDSGDYQGHVVAINLGSGRQVVFNVVCSDLGNVHFVKNDPNPPVSVQPDCPQQTYNNGNGVLPTGNGGIWGRAAAVYDPENDRIYLSTGNGVFDANTAGHEWGDSVLALPAALDAALTLPLDSYTPDNFLSLMYTDYDIGSTSIALANAPNGAAVTHIGIQSGKDSYLRVIDLDDMSRSGGPGHTGGELFTGSVPQGNEVKTQLLVWTNPATDARMLIVANNFGISATRIMIDATNGNLPALQKSGAPNWINAGAPVAGSATSTGGTSPVLANGVLYYAGGSGVLALDPASGSALWNDTAMGTATASVASRFHKQSLIVVGGRVFVADDAGKFWAYGLNDEIFASGFDS